MHPSYVTTYLSVGGWKAVLMTWDEEIQAYTPWTTGFGSYRTQEEASVEARNWAEAEEVAYREV